MFFRACHGGVPHPDILVRPTLPLLTRLGRLTKQRPLYAVGGAGGVFKIGGKIPPLRAKPGMDSEISRKRERRSRRDLGKTFGVAAQSREAVRQGGRLHDE